MKDSKNYKVISIYINESQKRSLEEFFERIDFHTYSIQTKLEGIWGKGIRHKNNQIWPGVDCLFYLIVKDFQVESMLKKLKFFRLGIEEAVVMSVFVANLDYYFDNIQKANFEPEGEDVEIQWE
ncbi:MAG: hypothetical protein RSD34_01975 [Cetobacterium sp.]